MNTATGRLIIAMEAAVQGIDFASEDERDRFINHLAATFPERLRQSVLTWRANDRQSSEQKNAPVPAESPPDHIVRERERPRAKTGKQ